MSCKELKGTIHANFLNDIIKHCNICYCLYFCDVWVPSQELFANLSSALTSHWPRMKLWCITLWVHNCLLLEFFKKPSCLHKCGWQSPANLQGLLPFKCIHFDSLNKRLIIRHYVTMRDISDTSVLLKKCFQKERNKACSLLLVFRVALF